MKRTFLIIAALSLCRGVPAFASTFHTGTPDVAAIQQVVDNGNTHDGDTVVVDANGLTEVTWSTALVITNKNITLQFPGYNVLTIKGGTPSGPTIGQQFKWTVHDVPFTAHLTGAHLHMTIDQGGDGKGLINASGFATLSSLGGSVAGGLYIDYCKVTAESNSIIGHGQYVFFLNGYIDGVMDECVLDFPNYKGSEIFNINHTSAPIDPQNPIGNKGQWSFYQPYVPGGDPTNANSRAFYFEDNVFHWIGALFDCTAGGGRFVIRYSTLWGHVGGHGVDTGGNMGTRAKEIYNNVILVPDGQTTSFQAITDRGAFTIAFNNYITNWPRDFGVYFYRAAGTSAMFGPADGTNLLDNNSQGSITVNGINFDPVTGDSPPPHIGSVYARASADHTTPAITTGTRAWKLTGLTSTQTDQWKGFCLRNKTTSPPETDGGSTLSGNYGFIISSTISGSDTIVQLNQPVGTPVSFAHDDIWEIRHVAEYFANPGAGKISSLLNNGNLTAVPKRTFKLLDSLYQPIPGDNPRFPGQESIGIWQKYNMSRANSTASYAPSVGWNVPPGSAYDMITPGGIHDNALPPGYPTSTSPKRAGADFDLPGFHEMIPVGDPNAPTYQGGAGYPHPLRSAVPPGGPIIYLAGPGLAFGNVIVGNAPTATLTVSNPGTALLTVTSVSYPAGFSGATGGFTVAAGAAHDITITFAPTAEILYTGDITVTSDATSGSGTITASGTGVPSAIPGRPGKKVARRN